jgi:hypothetical protein
MAPYVTENSPLLKNQQPSYQSPPEIVIEEDEHGNISVVSTSPKSTDSIDDQLLSKRLNGSPLMVVFTG